MPPQRRIARAMIKAAMMMAISNEYDVSIALKPKAIGKSARNATIATKTRKNKRRISQSPANAKSEAISSKVRDWKAGYMRFPRKQIHERYGLYKVPTKAAWKTAHASV